MKPFINSPPPEGKKIGAILGVKQWRRCDYEARSLPNSLVTQTTRRKHRLARFSVAKKKNVDKINLIRGPGNFNRIKQ